MSVWARRRPKPPSLRRPWPVPALPEEPNKKISGGKA